MASGPSIFLVFDGAWLEIETSLVERRGCLRAFAREAETKWDLEPSSYEFQHESGKVDSIAALQRAMTGASNGVCKLEISERPDGKMMRTMRKEMKLMEDRVMAKVENMLVEVRKENQCNETRLSGCIAPLVQCLAVEQIEMREKVAQLGSEVSNMASVEKASAAINVLAGIVKDAETFEHELQQECAIQAACDLAMSNSDCLQELKEEVSNLGEKEAFQADPAQPARITPPQGQGANIDFKNVFGESDSRLQWPTSALTSVPYSNKLGKGPLAPATGFEARWQPGDKWSYVKLGGEVATPFAQSIITPMLHSKSTFGHRSCPLLPPLQ